MYVKLKGCKTSSNEIIKYFNHAEIIILNKDNEEIARAIIDLEDVERCSKLKWGMGSQGYIENRSKRILLHQFILGKEYHYRLITEICDHINRNKLDNRKINLRIVSYSINNFNKNSKGYYYNNTYNKYFAYITVNHKLITLGRYDNEDDAIWARKSAECRYYPNIKLQIEAV